MRELLPRLTRLAALVNVGNPLRVPQWRETQAVAAQAALALVPFQIHNLDQSEAAFASFVQEKADALLVPLDVTFTTHPPTHRRTGCNDASAGDLLCPAVGRG